MPKRTDVTRTDAAIDAEIQKNRWRQALMMMTKLKQAGNRLGGRLALSAACKGGWSLALEVLEDTIDGGERCAPASVGLVTRACGRKNWQRALHLLRWIRTLHMKPIVTVFNPLSNSLGKAAGTDSNSWKWPLQCIQEASDNSLRASLGSYNTAMASLVQSLHWYHSFSVLYSLPTTANTFSDVSINTVATACEKKFRWEAAVATLRLGSLQGIQAEEIGFNAMISACANNGLWQVASILLKDLYGAGIQASTITLAATASAGEKANLWIQPLQLLRVGKFLKLSGPVLHGVALDALEKQGLWLRALLLFRLGEGTGEGRHWMDPMTVSAVVSACKAEWRQNLSLTAELSNSGGMSTEAWNACIHSCAGHVPIQGLLEWMRSLHFEPDMLSYVAPHKPGQNLIADSQSSELLFKIRMTRSEAIAALRRLLDKKAEQFLLIVSTALIVC